MPAATVPEPAPAVDPFANPDAMLAHFAHCIERGTPPVPLLDWQRDFLLLRVDANLRGIVGMLDEYRPLLERAQSRVTRFGSRR